MISCGISGLLGGRLVDGAPFNNLIAAVCDLREAAICSFVAALVFGVLFAVAFFVVAFLGVALFEGVFFEGVFFGLAMICSFLFIFISAYADFIFSDN
jgi:hypothetical protein